MLREARLRAGLTQAELGRRVRRTQSQIARWERGEVKPSLETLRELIRACGLELTLGLATYDDSYDEWIVRALEQSPADRLRNAARAAGVWRDLQRRVETARERAGV